MSLPYTKEIILPTDFEPCTIRELLKKLYVPKKWQHYLRIEENIKVNGQYKPFNFLTYPNDSITLTLTHIESTQTYLPSNHLPQVVYEDTDIIIINKPAGQKTHPNQPLENNTAINDVEYYLNQTNEHAYMIHRLDMWTNGLLLFAKNPAVVPILNRQLSQKIIKRYYLANVRLSEKIPSTGTFLEPIGTDDNDKRKRRVRKDGLKSITHYQVISQTSHTAKLQLELETGRTHQIRVHLSYHNMPIINDPLYDNHATVNDNMQLTAYKMTLIHPFSFESKTIRLPNQ